MRVLLVNTTCKVGGVSTFMLSLRRALLDLGHDCRLFFFERGTMEPHLPPDCPTTFGTLADCMRLVNDERIDVVHANNVDWPTGVSAIRRLGAKLILTAHKVRAEARCYGWTAANCDGLTAISEAVRQELQPYTDLPIQVVRNGIDTSTFSPDDRPRTAVPIVLWVGRSGSLIKRVDRFAAIAAPLRRLGFRIWVVDQHGPERAAQVLPGAVEALRPVAEFWGAVTFAAMPDLYRTVAASGGCIVSTSDQEGLGLGLLEAQACGCLAFGPDVPGVRESVSPAHGGVLYPPEMSAENLVDLIAGRLRDSATADSSRQAAIRFVRERFSRTDMARAYVRLYREMPIPARSTFLGRARRRLRLSPLLNWSGYLEHRWGVGHTQHATSLQFSPDAERSLRAAAAREAARTSPTLYLRPGRLAYLIRATLLGG